MKKRTTPYGMNDRLTFGEHRGKLIATLISRGLTKYLHWMWATLEAEFTKEVWDAIKKKEAEEAGTEEKKDA